jgi:hypothetical protein
VLDLPFFERVADVLRGLVPDELGPYGHKAHGYGIKVWFGAAPAREHYEAQYIRRRDVDGGDGWVIEVGFHAEHPKVEANEAVLAALLAGRKQWRRTLGDEAEAGPFVGRDSWRRLSEVWLDGDIGGADGELEVAGRLTDYITALEPVLRAR